MTVLVRLGMAAMLATMPATGFAEGIWLRAQLRGDNEVPPVNSPGKGEAEVLVDTASHEIRWSLKFQDLTAPLSATHFHGPSGSGGNAPILVPIANKLDRSGAIDGKASVNEQQIQDMLAGRWYINVHTPAFPSGEIRGQLFRR